MKNKIIKILSISLVLLGLILPQIPFGQNQNQIAASEEKIGEPFFQEPKLSTGLHSPGRIEETGTEFKIENSEYLNITLKSTEKIKIVLESIPRMISLDIQTSSSEITSTTLTLEGLEPNKTYFKYQDSYKNETVFISDENENYNWKQDLTQPHHIWIQEIKSTVFLPEDCSKYGTWNETTKTCTLTQDPTESVEIIANDITLDCNEHQIIGPGTGYGIYLNSKENIVIKNCSVKNFYAGINLWYSNSNTLTNNTISNNSYVGIQLDLFNNNNILTNNNLSNNYLGIRLWYSNDNTLTNNNISNNSFGISISSSKSNTFTNNNFSNSHYAGIHLDYSNDNTLTNNAISNNYWGIYIWNSDNNTVYLNNFMNNIYNVYPHYSTNLWNSQEKINYTYGGITYTNYLGNYWSDYTGSDAKGDGIGDTPYALNSDKDNYPLIKPYENYGWEAPPEENQPPTISNLGQFKSDGLTSIPEGGMTTESTVVFQATLSDPDNDRVKLQVELKEFNQSFNEQDLLESDYINSGSEATITKEDLANGQYHWRARAVDDKGNKSDWQEFGEAGNADFEVKLVPLYTQVRSPYPSDVQTAQWSIMKYGRGSYLDCWDSILGFSSIRSCGCAITSMVMLGRYYDIDTAIDDSNVDPGNINTWFTNNKGYTSDGSLWWDKAVEYLGFIDEKTGKKMVRIDFNPYTDFNVPSSSPRIDNFLAVANPIVARSQAFGHYFVIDGKLTSTYTLKDPTWYNTKKLNQPKNLAEDIQGYNNHFNTANLFSYLETPKPITSSMHLHLASPAELLITDPLGRKLGKNPILGIVYDEIPDSIYTQEGPIVSSDIPLEPDEVQESKIIYILSPNDGEYDIKVIGTDSGSYTMDLLAYDQNGQSEEIILEGNTAPNNIQEFELNYSSQIVEEVKVHRLVDIDIKPGSEPNSINLKSKGVVPVAILANNFFDTLNVIIDSILFADAKPLRGKLEDVDNDGDLDLILHFDTQSLQLSLSDSEAVLTAQLKDKSLIKGKDSVRIVDK